MNESNNASNTVTVILGNATANTLVGTSGGETLFGLAGDDTFIAEASDIINGGAGTDFLYQSNANPWNIDLGATSIEWMSAGFGSDTINAATQTASVE